MHNYSQFNREYIYKSNFRLHHQVNTLNLRTFANKKKRKKNKRRELTIFNQINDRPQETYDLINLHEVETCDDCATKRLIKQVDERIKIRIGVERDTKLALQFPAYPTLFPDLSSPFD